MDDGADVGQLMTEDLCGFSAFMNTVNSQKFQLFGNPESFKAKFAPAKNAYHLISKSNVQKRTLLFLFAWLYSYNFSSGISSTPSSACASNPLREINAYR